ncbi:MAG: hypothetical protein ABI232_12760 [Jatrophihabitantaceae bacterium]
MSDLNLQLDARRAQIDYRVAMITRDFRSLRASTQLDHVSWWQRRRRIHVGG